MQGRLTKMKKGHASAAFLLFLSAFIQADARGALSLNQLGASRFNPVAGFLQGFG